MLLARVRKFGYNDTVLLFRYLQSEGSAPGRNLSKTTARIALEEAMATGRRTFGLAAVATALGVVYPAFADNAEPSLSDEQAKAIIEKLWDGGMIVWPLGRLTVVRSGFGGKER